MTATRKLFAAAALVAAGYGVASFLGEPAAKTHSLQTAGAPISRQPAAAQLNRDVRLVPDFGAADSNKLPAAPLLVNTTPDRDAPNNEPINNYAEPLGGEDVAPWKVTPQARLRNEAPRPLAFESTLPTVLEPERPATIASAPPHTFEPATPQPPPFENARRHSADSASPRFEQSPTEIPTIVASYQEAASATSDIAPIVPPPWPAPEEAEGSRTHIVVDGDSLARLAGLYLDDPRRGGEIFEVNRGRLSDPELLPIGVELVIPGRSAALPPEYESMQSAAPRAVAIHAAAAGRLVPVRPVPSSADVAPQAKLIRPLPVE